MSTKAEQFVLNDSFYAKSIYNGGQSEMSRQNQQPIVIKKENLNMKEIDEEKQKDEASSCLLSNTQEDSDELLKLKNDVK